MRDFFYLSLEAISQKIDETISNTSIRRLVNYNYAPQPGKKLPYPRLVTSNIIVINPLELLEVAKDVGKFDVDLLQPDNDTENWIRKKCGLPLKSKTSRPRWAPIQTRLQEKEEGEFPAEPGTKPQEGGHPQITQISQSRGGPSRSDRDERTAPMNGGAARTSETMSAESAKSADSTFDSRSRPGGTGSYDREAHADDRPKDECGIVSGE
jgi:hypothetical protein